MSEFKFSCPHCDRHIQCDEQWSGREVVCPSCSGSMTIPIFGSAASGPATLGQVSGKKGGKNSKQIMAWSAGGLALIVVFYFGFKAVDKWDVTAHKKVQDISAGSSGGEVTHIAKLYQVLDATDPARMEKQQLDAQAKYEREKARMKAEMATKPDPTLAMPMIAPTWSLDAAAATIPQGRVNGSSGGKDWHIDNVRLDRGPALALLTFQEGAGTAADHEVLIYLPAPAAENLAGKKWSVTKESTSRQTMQIIRKWTADPRYAPTQKAFPKGYVLKLELDEPTRDWQQGRIYLALPDTNKTVLAGEFSISVPRKPESLMLQE